MAFRMIATRRVVLPAAAGLLGAGLVSPPIQEAFAEAPSSRPKKPIYDEPRSAPAPSASKSPSTMPLDTNSTSETPRKTPTSRLAAEIRRARLSLYNYAVATEDRVDRYLTKAFDLETSFTKTVASLAPPKESDEKLMPGIIYVLVAAMAGSIVSRNRNILVRAAVPLAAAVGTSWLVVPITSRNVGDLLWRYEQRSPFISQNHLRIRGAAEEAWMTARQTGEKVASVADQTVHTGRSTVEEWVKKGK